MDEIIDGLADQLTMKQNLNGDCLSKSRLQSKSTNKNLKCEKVYLLERSQAQIHATGTPQAHYRHTTGTLKAHYRHTQAHYRHTYIDY